MSSECGVLAVGDGAHGCAPARAKRPTPADRTVQMGCSSHQEWPPPFSWPPSWLAVSLPAAAVAAAA